MLLVTKSLNGGRNHTFTEIVFCANCHRVFVYSCMPVNPSCVEEPCPAQPKQVVTIPTIEVGKEGLAAFTVWINVNGFP